MLESIGAPPATAAVDHCVVLRHVGWREYEALAAARGDSSKPRMTYLDGTLWIMSPSPEHDAISRMFDRLLTAFAEETGVELNAFGSWTLKREPERGVEADESYVVGPRTRDVPDLVIEVVWTVEIADKLDVYCALGVPEAWVWKGGGIEVHVLGERGYERAARSVLLPALDLDLAARLVTRTDQISAVREWRAAVRAR